MAPIDTSTTTTTAAATIVTEPPSGTGETPPSLLPDPMAAVLSTGDVGAEIAALDVEDGQVQRSEARQEREADEARAEHEEAQEVSAIRAEASSMRAQGWVDAAITVVAYAATAASSPSSPSAASGQDGGHAASDADGGLVAKAGRALADGYFTSAQKDDEANAKADEAATTDAKSAADDAHDAFSDANGLIAAALQFYQEYVTTRAQTMTVAAQRSENAFSHRIRGLA